MKNLIFTFIVILVGAPLAFADEVIFAGSDDLAAFDQLVRKSKRTSKRDRVKQRRQIESDISEVISIESRKSKRVKKSGGGSDSISTGGSGNSGSTTKGKSDNKGKGKGKKK